MRVEKTAEYAEWIDSLRDQAGRARILGENTISQAPEASRRFDPRPESTYTPHMKAVQIMFEEALLEELDNTSEVREKGRSAVLRELASDFLRRRREREIDAQYERAYAGVENPLGKDFEDWDKEGVWPPE